MGIFPKRLVHLLLFLQKVGNFFHSIEQSKFIRFMKRNRLFTLIPMAFLSWQLAITREENEGLKEQRDFYQTRLDTYYRDWEEIEFGMWEKIKVGDRFVFIGVNNAYVNNFLKPNELVEADVIGKDNIETFGEKPGREWRQNDSLVAITGQQVNAVEPAKYGEDYGYVFISKWRKVRRNGDTTVIGMAIKIDTILGQYFRGLRGKQDGEPGHLSPNG